VSRITIVLFLLISFFWLSACDENRVYEENQDFGQKVWLVDSVPAFEFEITDPQQPYNIYWNIRNTLNYPFHNLYLTYYLEDTLGRRIATDLHNMLLFDPKTGEPYGSGLGDIFSHQIMALPTYKFDSAGIYRIRLQQYMRTDTLKDILSVGVRVEKAE
jgi:gliding motility-associated lipoprotein GldH